MSLFENLKEARAKEDRPERIGATTDSIALVASAGGQGVILAYDGEGIEADVDAVGLGNLADHGLDDAPDGLSIWEGRLYCSNPDYWTGEVDCELVGMFRDLTDDEWKLLRETGTPWAFEPLPTKTTEGT